MRHWLPATACLVSMILLDVPAQADPVRVRLLGSAYSHYNDYSEFATARLLPDNFRGGVLFLGEDYLRRKTEPDPTFAYGGSRYAAESTAIDSPFQLELDFGRPGDAPESNRASVYLSGDLTGSIFGPRDASHLSGGFSGVVKTAELKVWYPRADTSDPYWQDHLTDYVPGPEIPREFLDLFTHPERLHLQGLVTGGYQNVLETRLFVDPPPAAAAVPEPTALGAILAGLAAIGSRRARARRAGPGV